MSAITLKSSSGNDRVFARLAETEPKTRAGVRHAWFELAQHLKKTANAEIKRKPKGGRTYIIRTRGGRKRRHVASAPGETHANLRGKLRKSLSWKVHGTDSMDFGYGLVRSDDPEYAAFVEFGTRRMAERPSLKNAIDTSDGVAQRAFTDSMNREFK